MLTGKSVQQRDDPTNVDTLTRKRKSKIEKKKEINREPLTRRLTND